MQNLSMNIIQHGYEKYQENQTAMSMRNHIMNINSNDYVKSQYEYHTAWL